MSHEQPSRKRQTIRIKLPPKPAAPRHSLVVVRAISMPIFGERPQARRSPFIFPLVQMAVASILAMMVLDFGECSHVIVYAALGYVGGLLLMVPRRNALTPTDEFLIRWGFVILFFVSAIIAAIIWPLRLPGI